MVRLGFHVNIIRKEALYRVLSKMEFNLYSDVYQSRRLGKYNYLINVSEFVNSNGGINKFTIGLDLCEANNSHSGNCFIEFNPNKNDMNFIWWLLDVISQFVVPVNGEYFDIKRYDLAVDIPCKRSEVMLVKSGKRTYTRMITDSVTEYLGKHNSNGFTKVYDKTVESNLDYDLTRVEITCDSLTDYSFPEVYVVHDNDMDLTELNDTDTVIVSMLRQFEHDEQLSYLRAMGRRKQEKLKPYIYPKDKQFNFNLSLIAWLMMDIEQLLTLGHGYGRLLKDEKEYERQVREKCRSAVIEEFEQREQEILKEYAADEEVCRKLQEELWDEYYMIKNQWELEEQRREQIEKENKIVEEEKDDETYKQYTLFV